MSAPAPISEAQLDANRANAQLSTGPRSAENKAKVSLNAVKTGLTGRNIFLPGDDAAKYKELLDLYFAEYKPVGVLEAALVQSIVDCRWRIDRVPGLESSIYNVGLQRLREQNPDVSDLTAEGNEFEIQLMFEKQLRNIHLQESRLAKRMEKDTKELQEMQELRQRREQAEMQQAATLCLVAQHRNQPFDLAANGFAFPKQRFDQFFAQIPAPQKQIMLKRALLNVGETAKGAA